MSNTVGSMLRRSCGKERPLYLYVPDDTIYLKSILENVDADFVVIPETPTPISSFNFNGIICTNRSANFDQLFSLSQRFHIPLICYESLLPGSAEIVQGQMHLTSPINIFSQNTLSKYWGIQKYHVISPAVSCPVFDEIVKDYSTIHFATDHNGQELINLVRSKNLTATQFDGNTDLHKVTYYINTLLQPNTVVDILRILSVGGIVCTLKHPLISELIINNHNGIIAEDIPQLQESVKTLFSNLALKQSIEKNAKETIQRQYNGAIFKKRWESVNNEIKQFVFKGIL